MAHIFQKSITTQPYVVAYDISSPKRARRIRNSLKAWRLDGQYSVHEVSLSSVKIYELLTELRSHLEPETDRLLSCRLHQRGLAAIFGISLTLPRPSLAAYPISKTLPQKLAQGCYLLAYDIRDAKRLVRFQRKIAKYTTALQRSVYLYQGDGGQLKELIEELRNILLLNDDDFRVYPIAQLGDLWILSGAKPHLVGLA